MKILFTTDSIHRGGKERQIFILTTTILESGFDVCIVTRKFSEENYLSEYRLEESIARIYKGKTWVDEFYLFKRIIISEKPDIMISWDLQTSLFALLLHRKYNFKFVNASIQHGIRLFRLVHILRSITCFFSPYVMANSFAGLKANNLKPGKRRFVLNNGIEAKFQNIRAKSEVEDLRERLIPDYNEKPCLVYISVANFVPYKDYFTVIKALAKIKSSIVFRYLILGDGPMRGEIEKAINDFGLEKQVFLIGKTENVKEYLFASDIMIHSSRGEGISNAILEGMYAGLPIIATNVGGIPETVFPASSILFPYKDVDALYHCLLKSLELKASFNPESEEYKAHLKKFSVDTMISRFEEIIGEVMKR